MFLGQTFGQILGEVTDQISEKERPNLVFKGQDGRGGLSLFFRGLAVVEDEGKSAEKLIFYPSLSFQDETNTHFAEIHWKGIGADSAEMLLGSFQVRFYEQKDWVRAGEVESEAKGLRFAGFSLMVSKSKVKENILTNERVL